MQPNPLDYFSPPARKAITPIQRTGRCIAAASLLLPFLAFGFAVVCESEFGVKGAAIGWIMTSALFLSCALGLVALAGIFWWGEKNVWGQAVLGIAFSVALLLVMFYGGP